MDNLSNLQFAENVLWFVAIAGTGVIILLLWTWLDKVFHKPTRAEKLQALIKAVPEERRRAVALASQNWGRDGVMQSLNSDACPEWAMSHTGLPADDAEKLEDYRESANTNVPAKLPNFATNKIGKNWNYGFDGEALQIGEQAGAQEEYPTEISQTPTGPAVIHVRNGLG